MMRLKILFVLAALSCFAGMGRAAPVVENPPHTKSAQRLLYVAVPGIRNYLEFGGHGILVFDIDKGHKFVKRIKAASLGAEGKPLNVKGICASAVTDRLYVSTITSLSSFKITTSELLWEKKYAGGCDRMSITPDGKVIYLPSFERAFWNVVNADTGGEIAKITPDSGAHNTIVGQDGKWAYLAGLRSPLVTVADVSKHAAARTIGPFSAPVRPFTVDSSQSKIYVCVNELLGFEIGDISSGKVLHQVTVEGFKKGAVKRHGCPSHGIGLTPDEKEIWLCDAANERLHVFDVSVSPPKQKESIAQREQPGWVTFTIDGKYAYSSTGEVIDTATKKIVVALADENGTPVHSEKVIEIDFVDGKPVRVGDQFGVGRATPPATPAVSK